MKIIKLKKYSDGRGSLVENTQADIFKKTKHFFVSKSKPGVIRGNHYHLRKSEWFYVIQGECKLVIRDIKTGKKETRLVKANQNIIINMEPGKSHAFKNIGKEELILLALINEVHNQKDPDTYSYKVI
jgi:UDP-2-acetamido-2,6-beta-L-arabino-hexul-4-ose reductase